MAHAACELVPVATAIFIWQHYDPAIKADLFSTGVVTANEQVVIVDPIPLAASPLDLLRERGRCGGVVTTNTNHRRAANWYSAQFCAPIFAHRASFPDVESGSIISVAQGDKIVDELEVIDIDGAAAGEIALYDPMHGGTLIMGDALINFAPYGFAFLPRKYCTHEKQMRRSLRKLLDYEAERMLFAHGTPIVSSATTRLRQLLDAEV
jgi:glyoxylase-like metal-dependent hydrolase (beta-lactamase superfamily II)